MSRQRVNITADGSATLRISAVNRFITIDNDTDALITVYDNVGMLNPANVLYEIKPYTARCYPLEIAQENETLYTMTWNGTDYPNYFGIMLTTYDTHNNLLYPQSGSADVTIVADSLGLARTNQLPAGLTADGNLKVGVNEDLTQLPADLSTLGNLKVGVSEDLTQLPADLSTAGNLKVRVNENLTQLPSNLSTAGNLKVGVSEDLAQLPAALSGPGGVKVSLISVNGYTWEKITFSAAGDSAALGGAGTTLVGWECSGTATAYPLDGSSQAWKSLNKKDFTFPIRIANTLKIHADAACSVWVYVR